MILKLIFLTGSSRFTRRTNCPLILYLNNFSRVHTDESREIRSW